MSFTLSCPTMRTTAPWGMNEPSAERAAQVMRQLTDMGISVAVDDFGTGYSNLSYLIDFPFQKLKIDRSFVDRIDKDNGGAVVSTIVGLSRALGVRTIAEGVETKAHVDFLKNSNCDIAQGFYFAKPMPVPEFERIAF